MYMLNRIGPRIDPWGNPALIFPLFDVVLATFISNSLLQRYDFVSWIIQFNIFNLLYFKYNTGMPDTVKSLLCALIDYTRWFGFIKFLYYVFNTPEYLMGYRMIATETELMIE